MKTKKVFWVTFAGPVGSGKTPIANYLSYNFSLPIINNDAIRTEVMEDLGRFEINEYERRRDLRLNEAIKLNKPLIYDASIDRNWETRGKEVKNLPIDFFIISLDISRELLIRIYQAKKYSLNYELIDNYLDDHQKFLEINRGIVNVHITDENFKDRLEICRDALDLWLSS